MSENSTVSSRLTTYELHEETHESKSKDLLVISTFT